MIKIKIGHRTFPKKHACGVIDTLRQFMRLPDCQVFETKTLAVTCKCGKPFSVILSEDLSSGEIFAEGPLYCPNPNCQRDLATDQVGLAPLTDDEIESIFGLPFYKDADITHI